MACLLIIAHAPLASAFKAVALHAYPEAAGAIEAVDVVPETDADRTESLARTLLDGLRVGGGGVLILTDVCGATPSNVAQRLVDGRQTRVVAGLNLPMLWRTLNYRHEPLDELSARALAGAVRGVMALESLTVADEGGKKLNET